MARKLWERLDFSKKYQAPDMKSFVLESSNGFLTGSVTNVKIQVSNVSVEPYQDGFADEGGFKDINFD